MSSNTLSYAAGPHPAPGPVVHESEAQRQHARVRLPGQLELTAATSNGAPTSLRFPLHDLSAGGLSFVVPAVQLARLRPGVEVRGQVVTSIDGIGVTVPVELRVLRCDASTGRVGAQFQNLGRQEISALRHLITSFLAGDIVDAGGLLHTLGRDNFTKPRSAAPGSSASGRGRAMAITLLVAVLGLSVASYSVGQVQRWLFVTEADAAKVAGTVFTVTMPREGSFRSLVPESGEVAKGAPIASFETTALDLVRGQLAAAELDGAQLEKLLSQTVKGTISSPCDCRVQARFAADEQYLTRGETIFQLTPLQGAPQLLARFDYPKAGRLKLGSEMQFQVSGDGQWRQGKISQIRVAGDSDSVDNDLLVTVTPEQPLPVSLVNRPAKASLGRSYSVSDLVPVALAHWGGDS
ncbi:MAG: PilZ domain-containing protein [Stagnimonas sp.]|nr:PilZ domain-containing protein [Stagnimonas sp.]